ncbi:hypothetical protein DHEL01_v201676 [Diaporthe helianthi]|uniref:Uncharacterized protein n=1 Tax=Diaporthe helianthi TaxID=158607 RepID=A0A2P5IBN5_DIAHE|nr:hypothetical protein DHEL01_v201676 [Diaporthe helianthi]
MKHPATANNASTAASMRWAVGYGLSGASFNFCHERHTYRHSESLRPLEDSAAVLLDEWSLTTTYLWSRITPEHLSISLVCDFDPQDENTPSAATRTVTPLIYLSPLKGCHIRLSRIPHHGPEEIARGDATAVFFTGNRFVVRDFKSVTPWDTPGIPHYLNDRLAITEFLREVVPVDCLHLLRSLEFTFPPYNPKEWPQEGGLALCDWAETVRLIKEKMNLEGLTMRLTIFEAPVIEYAGARRHMTGSDAHEVLQAYNRNFCAQWPVWVTKA